MRDSSKGGLLLPNPAPAVHTRKNDPASWVVELGKAGVYIRLITGAGKMLEFCMGADAADRMAGALHAAAVERKRIVTMQKGDHVGRIQ